MGTRQRQSQRRLLNGYEGFEVYLTKLFMWGDIGRPSRSGMLTVDRPLDVPESCLVRRKVYQSPANGDGVRAQLVCSVRGLLIAG